MTSDAELEQAGLYVPDGPHAAERLALLHYLVQRSATLDDLLEYREELPALAMVVALRHGDPLTVDDMARRSGVDRDQVVRIVRACGFTEPGPDERAFSDGMARLCALVPSAVDLFGDEAVFQLLRVMGASSIRMADALVSSFLANVEPTVRDGDLVGLELAKANVAAVELFPEVVSGLDTLLRQHLVQLRRSSSGHDGGYETRDLCVGFIDLVDSTVLARDVPMDELGDLLSEFERLASDTVTAGGGRGVKLIGDEVLYTTDDPTAAARIALEVTGRLHDHPQLPEVRAGVVSGRVMLRDGDVFGPVVHLAARVVKVGAPGDVIASAGLAGDADVPSVPLGPRDVRGFGPVDLFKLVRPPAATGD